MIFIEDDEMNLKNKNTRNFKEKEIEKQEFQKNSIESVVYMMKH